MIETGQGTAQMDAIAVVVAAGKGVRAGGGLAKQHRPIGGVSALARSLALFLAEPLSPRIAAVVGVIRPGDETLYEDAAALAAHRTGPEPQRRILPPIHGGVERQDSVRRALEALAASERPPRRVLIHDAARPFTPPRVIASVLEALENGAESVCPALPVADTLRRDVDGMAGDLVDRAGLIRAQTPQGFRFETLLAAHRRFSDRPVTDDCELMRLAGYETRLVPGSEDAFKITLPEDFDRAEALAARQEGSAMSLEYRTGTGFDVHAFGANADGSRDHVWLCGLKLPHDDGLKGHSDADVGLHALTDAVLGALSMGDIGAHFPPSDDQWRGAASDRFLAFAADAARKRGGRVTHLDVTLICERPKIRPHVEAMRARVAEIADIALDRVSVKATTTEQLGFTGRREGIAAMATATVALPVPAAD